MIISDAHEWVAAMDGKRASVTHVKCARCEIEVSIREMPTGGCRPHGEGDNSGWPAVAAAGWARSHAGRNGLQTALMRPDPNARPMPLQGTPRSGLDGGAR
jgi:hypothetical protein